MIYLLLAAFIIVLALAVSYKMRLIKSVRTNRELYRRKCDLEGNLELVHEAYCTNANTVSSLKLDYERLKTSIDSLNLEKSELSKKLSKEVSRNKSVEVRTGQIMEKLTPFLEVFKYNPRAAQFLGQPVDFIVFDDEEIIIVEVKTGKARLSTKQNRIKKQVEEGKVRFETIRFDWEEE